MKDPDLADNPLEAPKVTVRLASPTVRPTSTTGATLTSSRSSGGCARARLLRR